jgi:Flp pilus assembly protein TadD
VEAAIVAEAPELDRVYAYLGFLRLVTGQKEEAAKLFRRALELEPQSALAKNGLERTRPSP